VVNARIVLEDSTSFQDLKETTLPSCHSESVVIIPEWLEIQPVVLNRVSSVLQPTVKIMGSGKHRNFPDFIAQLGTLKCAQMAFSALKWAFLKKSVLGPRPIAGRMLSLSPDVAVPIGWTLL